MNINIVILCGGMGTRLYPITKNIPKALVKIAGKPFIIHQLDLLIKQNIKKVIICSGYLGEQIYSLLGDNYLNKISIKYSNDGDSLIGTGGAIMKSLHLIDSDNFIVMYGDSYLLCPILNIYEYYNSIDSKALMTIYKNKNKWDTSNCIFNNGLVTLYDKNNVSNEMSYIDYGLSILNKSIFLSYLKEDKLDLSLIFNKLSLSKLLNGFEVTQRFYEIGSFSGIKEAEIYFKTLQ